MKRLPRSVETGRHKQRLLTSTRNYSLSSERTEQTSSRTSRASAMPRSELLSLLNNSSPEHLLKIPALQELERREQLRLHEQFEGTLEESRERCRKLRNFVREAWHILHPRTPYVHGWHIDLICKHLEAITYGKFKEYGYDNRLLINEPPGTMKSLLVNVFWAAWEWGPAGMPHIQNIGTSYKGENCSRDVARTRDLILSEWYQQRWPLNLIKTGEQHIANDKRGDYRGIPFGSLTQFRADRLKIDDPHSVDTAESDADRARATIRFRESATSRLNDPITSAIIIIMQRLHEQDISGVAIKLDLGYLHLCLPMEFDPARKCITPFGEDRRTVEGELLFPERFPREVVERDKKAMGPYAIAGQYQQRPAPREGGMFKHSSFNIVDAIPNEAHKHQVRSWDLAASIPKAGSDPSWTVGVRMMEYDGDYYIEHVARFRDDATSVRKNIKVWAISDTKRCHITVPQDPGQAGKDQAESFIRELAGWVISAKRPSGDKVTRAEPFAAQVGAGNVHLLRGDWNQAFIDELCNFPTGHADQVDAASDAFNYLSEKKVIRIPDDILAKSAMPQRRLH